MKARGRRAVLEARAKIRLAKACTRALAQPCTRTPLIEWGPKYLPHYFPERMGMSRMHHWVADQLDRLALERGQKSGVVGPRGGAKTTWIMAHALRSICERTEQYILLLAETGDQANKYLTAIKGELRDNDDLARDYPNATGRGSTWNVGSILTRNGVAVEALGMGHAIRGRKFREARPSLVLVDDPEGKKHAISPREREKSWDYLNKDVLNAGDERTNYFVAGTAIHRDCMALRLLKHHGWVTESFKSIEGMPEQMDMALWSEWEQILLDITNPDAKADARAFYDRNRAAMDAGATVLWKEREDLYSLMLLRADIGHNAWGGEKQSNPVNPELCEWPEAHFGDHIWFEEWPQTHELRVMALDPSKGRDSRHGDYSAIIMLTIGVRKGGVGLLLVDADLARRPTEEMIYDCARIAAEFQPDAFAVETNQYQELLVDRLDSALEEAGCMCPIVEIENYAPKPVRIRLLGPYLARHQYRFRRGSKGTALTVEQLKDFPLAGHDDGPDALEMAQRTAQRLFNDQYQPQTDGLGGYLDVGVP